MVETITIKEPQEHVSCTVLGRTYRDLITGFKGVAIAHVRYLTGCDQVCLHPGLKPDGSVADALYVDYLRLMEVPEVPDVCLPTIAGAKPGGRQDACPGRQV